MFKHKSLLRQIWEQWKKKNAGVGGITIDLVYEKRKDEGFTGYNSFFALEKTNEYEEVVNNFPFVLGIDSNYNLDGNFKADYSGNCTSKFFCKWIRIMEEYVKDEYENGLIDILNKAFDTYQFLEKNPKEYADTRTVTTKPIWRETSLLNVMKSNKLVKVNPLTDNDWNLTVEGAHTTITANLKMRSRVSGILCTLRVLKPRIAIGKNVNFGGGVSGKGLTEISSSKNIEQALENVVNALYDEVPFEDSSYDYTDEEYRAAAFIAQGFIAQDVESDISNASAVPQVATVPVNHSFNVATLSNMQHIDDSSVIINPGLYKILLSDKDISVWLKVKTSLGMSTWVVAHPGLDNVMENNMYVTDTFLSNLNCSIGERVTVSRGVLPLPSSVKIRCRGNYKDTLFVKEYIEKMNLLVAGSTYLAHTDEHEAYFDVFYAGKYGVCSLTTVGDVDFEISYPLKILDPLAVEYYDDDTSEED